MSYILILHQTTTSGSYSAGLTWLSYILILHQTTTCARGLCYLPWLSYILILHQTTTLSALGMIAVSCLISLFYIKPQQYTTKSLCGTGCLISLFYIKPQPVISCYRLDHVVLYPYSTSNHNFILLLICVRFVVLYPYSTSNHNSCRSLTPSNQLSYILILHQTTTRRLPCLSVSSCLISLFYIKPQHNDVSIPSGQGCLISLFYIKPQLCTDILMLLICCLISLFYIKPQQ